MMRNAAKSWFWVAGLLLSAALATSMPGTSRADETAPFSGKQITISVGYGAGGGFDLYARLLSKYMGEHIAGNPSIVVKNMTGAGSLKLANYLYSVAPKDGTEFGIVAQTLPVDQLLGSPGISFDFTKFNPIGRMATMGTVIVSSTTVPVKSIDDVKKHPINIAATGPSSEATIVPQVLNSLIGTKFKIVGGYRGTHGYVLSSGEKRTPSPSASPLSCRNSPGSSKTRKSLCSCRMLWSGRRHFLMSRRPSNSCRTRTIARSCGCRSRRRYRPLLHCAARRAGNRIAILRKAFMQTMADPAFKAAAQKAKLDLEPADGSALEAVIKDIGGFPRSLIAKARTARTLTK